MQKHRCFFHTLLSGMTKNYQAEAERNRNNKLKCEKEETHMKREDITRIFEGATKEQIDELLNINSADIGSAKSGTAQQISALTQQVTDLQAQMTQRDTDMTALQEQLTAAQTDAGKLTEAQTALTALQTKYAADQQKWDEKIKKQAYEFAIREQTSKLAFTSAAAQRDFIREATGKKLPFENGQLMGFDDFAAAYRAANPGALVEEKEPEAQPDPTPQLVLPQTPQGAAAASGDGFNFGFLGVRPRPQG